MGRSSAPEFDKYILKEYQHWTLFLHENQRCIGRAYLWLARPGAMQRLSEIVQAERDELWKVMREYEVVLQKLWQPDHINYLWLGNGFKAHGGHGHMHLIPRYKDAREFLAVTFADEEWSRLYDFSAPSEHRQHTVREIMRTVQQELR